MRFQPKPDENPRVQVKTHVRWSHEDNEYVATHDDYPSLSWLDTTITSAVLGLHTLVSRIENDNGVRHDLDDVLTRLGLTRADLEGDGE